MRNSIIQLPKNVLPERAISRLLIVLFTLFLLPPAFASTFTGEKLPSLEDHYPATTATVVPIPDMAATPMIMTTFYGPGTTGPIPPVGTSGTSTYTLNVPDNGNITDINVLNLVGTHSWTDDLDIFLISPAGTSVQLLARRCGSSDNFNLNFDDSAPAGAPSCPLTLGNTFRPDNSSSQTLADFNGEDAFGDWTLTIVDNNGGDSGNLENWGLEITTGAAPPPPPPCDEIVTACYGDNQTNAILSEICPAAGFSMVDIEFLAGEVESNFDDLDIYSGPMGSGTSGTQLANDLDGDLTGQTYAGQNADDCITLVITSDFSISCQSTLDEMEICVNSSGEVAPGCPAVGGPFCYSAIGTLEPVAVDICPDAGFFIEVTITAGAVENTFDEFQVYCGPMGSGSGGTQLYNDFGAGGDLAGLVFTCPLPDQCISLYVNSDAGGFTCASSGFTPISYSTACVTPPPCDEIVNACYGNNQTNAILSEICPAAGFPMVDIEFLAGEVESNFDDLDIYSGPMGSGTSGTQLANDLDGDLTGLTYAGQNADDCITLVISSDFSVSCQSEDLTPMEICVNNSEEVADPCASDMTPPEVTCAEFSETFFRCPGFIGPNTPPDTWTALNSSGTFSSFAGGSSSQSVDVSACVSDDNSALEEIERSLIASYEEDRTACSVTIVNEYAFRDACGNVADETVLVKFIFEDPGVDPSITCPADATVECGMSTDPSATGMATADDDCPADPTVTFSDSFAPSCSSGTGTITRTWTATDECGGTTSCEQLITIVDTEAPTVTCAEFTTTIDGGCVIDLQPNTISGGFGPIPVNGTINVLLGINTGAIYTLDLNGCVSDECTNGFAGLEISLVSSTVDDEGCGQTLTNTYSIRDACGNVSADLVTIVATFSDMEAPEVTCADFTMTFDACPAGFGPNTPDPNPDDGWFPVGDDGMINRVFGGGDFALTLDVNDCLSDNCTDLADLEYRLASGYIESSVPGCSLTLVDELIIRDACGNISEDRIIVRGIIQNTSDAMIVCPPDVDLSCGDSTDPADTGMATATDACGDVSVTYSDEITMRCNNGAYTIIRTWTAEGCGEPATCDQLIIISDTEAPEFDDACQTDFTFTTEGGNVCPDAATITLTEGDELDLDDTWTVGGNMVPSLAGCVSDNCALDEEITVTVDDISITHAGGTCGRTIAVTFIADDGCGNDSEPFTISYTFIDDTAPVFDLSCQVDATFFTENGDVCPADATISLNEGDQIDVFTGWTVGGNPILSLQGCVADNCTAEGDLTITVDDITVTDESTCSRTITVTFIADDGCGNFSEPFVCNYTFIDDTAPVFDLACQVDVIYTTENGNVCPADATISLSEGDEIDVFTGWTVGGNPILSLQGCVFDNCTAEGDLTITVDDITVTDESTCSRTITITFIADDGCGNFSEPFVCNYTFIDDTAPVFDLACQIDAVFTTEDGNVCPADATISLNEGDEIDVFTGWTVGGIPILPLQGCVFDNCTSEADLTITVDDITVVDDGTCSRVITVTFIADDGCGNFSDPFVCNYTFIDNTGPEVSFNGIPDGGTYVIECDLPSTTWDPLIDIGELTITDNCSAIDFAGITEVLTQLYDGPCTGNLLTRWQQVFTVQDVCGNTTVYTLFTEIIDTTPPVFETSPADVTIECDETAPLPELEAFDSCSEVDYSFTEVRTDGSCPNNYTLTRTWTATDGCGNASSEVQIVTVEDTTAPEFEFIDEYIADYEPGQNVFVECSELGNISQVIANNAVATDNCSGNTPVTYTLEDLGSFNCLEFGYSGAFISRWFTVDECGNAATASINWFLVDETAPTFQNLPDDTCADADDLPPVADVQAVDDCESAALTFSQSDPIDCEDGGQYIERTWTAEDACGNVATHTQRITLGGANGLNIVIDYPEIGDVEDGDLIQLPIDCDQDIAFSLADLEAAISVADGCGAGSGQATIEINLMDEGDCTENGYLARYRVNVSAMDACGNSATLGIMIDFVDQTGPVVSSPNELTLNCGDDIPMIEATDACGEIASMTFVDSAPIETSCPDNPVAYDRTWTVTDACGNATTFLQSIIVLDNDGPVFSGVPADDCNNTGIDVVVTAIDGCTGDQAQVTFDEVMSNEAGCGQVLTRTWTATDACGNTSTATQQVFFDDDVAPTIEFTSDLVFGLASGDELFLNVGDGLGDPNDPLFLTAEDVTVSDNCATITAQVIVESTISEDCAADGYLARYDYKFVATDPCGNSSSVELTVFYVDGNAPNLLNVPDDEEVICAAIPAVADVTASDDYDEEVEVIFSETQMATAEGVLITRTWTATDKCGNTNSVSQEILVVNNDLDATFSFGSDVIECNSDNNRLGVTPTGGTPPYTYDWELTFPLEDGYITTDPTFPSILFTMGYITQTFTVNITDANGCEYAASVTIVCDFSDDEGDFTGNGSGSSVNLNVYPNPVSDQLMVKATGLNDAPVTVALYNLFGQELSRTEVDTWTQEGLMIDTRRFPNGTYLLRLTAEGQEVQTREVVILH